MCFCVRFAFKMRGLGAFASDITVAQVWRDIEHNWEYLLCDALPRLATLHILNATMAEHTDSDRVCF